MTREEIIAKHDAEHLQHELRRVKVLSDQLDQSLAKVRAKFPKSKEVEDIAMASAAVATVVGEAVSKPH